MRYCMIAAGGISCMKNLKKYPEAGDREPDTFKRGNRPIHIPTKPRAILMTCFKTAGL